MKGALANPKGLAFVAETAEASGARNYLFFAGGCLVLNFFLMAGEGLEMIGFFALLMAVPGLLARWTISACLYLLIVGYQLFDPGLYGLYERYAPYALGREGFPRAERLLLALGVLGFAFAQFRLLGFWREAVPPRFQNRGALRDVTEGPLARPLANGREEEFYGFALQLLLCALGGLLVVFFIGDWGHTLAKRRGTPLEFVLDSYALLVVTLAVIPTAFYLICLVWERGTPWVDRAYLTLADTLWNETRREQQRIGRWARWTRRRQRRRKS